MKPYVIVIFFALFTNVTFAQFDVQGHRGARGIYPENTIKGFIYAVSIGATTLEMDVVVSKDGKVVVSHESYLNSKICLDTLGKSIKKSEQKNYNLFTMTYDQIQKCDCGSLGHSGFAQQKKMKTYKPLLSNLIDTIEAYIALNKLPEVHYNIEIKSKETTDDIFHPKPRVFVAKVLNLIKAKNIALKTTIQSFDSRVLEELNKQDSSVSIAYLLVLKPIKSVKKLSFKPTTLSPHYSLVNKKLLRYAKDNNVRVVPWTVNKEEKMQQLIAKGVDGIITDYPNMLIYILKEE